VQIINYLLGCLLYISGSQPGVREPPGVHGRISKGCLDGSWVFMYCYFL